MGRIAATILLVAVLVFGGGLIAATAYNAGLTAAAAGSGTAGTVVAPVVVPAWGWGWGFGSIFAGFFGFLFFLFVLFLVFGLIRAIVWGGRSRRGWAGHGWGPGGWGPGGPADRDAIRTRWESRAHDTFDTWHREAHGGAAGPTGGAPTAGGAADGTAPTGSGPAATGAPGPTMG